MADVRDVVRFHLEREGYRVSVAATGREAIELLEKEPPDLVLLDLSMPDLDGWAVLEAAEQGQFAGLRVAILTAESDEMIEHRARRAGAVAYLVKPLELSDLSRAVRRLLEPEPESPGE
ncbi:MAG: histidine kinase [Acidimicrobiales bacterium]|nr:histidine kinase [Acidimicrobiales bacterium]